MDESLFHRLAEETLATLAEALEPAFESGALEDMECAGGVLTLTLPSGRVVVVSKHTASQQIWLASPQLGGLHFRYHATAPHWQLPDGRNLEAVLQCALEE